MYKASIEDPLNPNRNLAKTQTIGRLTQRSILKTES